MSEKILLLEDEESIRRFVKINLYRSGFEVVEAGTGEEALKIVKNQQDIMIAVLDVMLPGISGYEVCKQIRKDDPEMGIIMLTAKTQEMDKINGLVLGADDYVTKPFSPQELVARIQSLLRRVKFNKSRQHIKNQVIVFSPFELNLNSQQLYKNGQEIELTPTEYLLINFFIENKGRALSRDELLNEVWGKNYIGDLKIVDVNIRRLRKKIEEDTQNPKYIKTVWGVGYRWRKKDETEGD